MSSNEDAPILKAAAATKNEKGIEQCGHCDTSKLIFRMSNRNGNTKLLCGLCIFKHKPLLIKSLLTAIVVGTILVLINAGNKIFANQFPSDLYWKIPLTYCVPFLVATWGALINSKISREVFVDINGSNRKGNNGNAPTITTI